MLDFPDLSSLIDKDMCLLGSDPPADRPNTPVRATPGATVGEPIKS